MFVIQSISTRQRYECSFREDSLHWCRRRDSSIELAKKKFNHWESMQMFNCFRTWFLQVSQAFYGNLSSWVPIFGCLITVILKVKKVICRNVHVLCFGFCRIRRTFSGFFQKSSLHTFLFISWNPPQFEVWMTDCSSSINVWACTELKQMTESFFQALYQTFNKWTTMYDTASKADAIFVRYLCRTSSSIFLKRSNSSASIIVVTGKIITNTWLHEMLDYTVSIAWILCFVP